jgi:cytochrome c oxidase subunit II
MITLLTWAVIVLAIIAAFRLIKIYELASALRGGRPQWEVTEQDNRMNGNLMMIFMIAFLIFGFWHVWEYKDRILPVSASEHGVEIDWLFNFNMIIIGFVAVVTNFFLFYFAFKYRGSAKNNTATFFPESHKLELIWTVVPGIALAVIVFLGITTWNNITSVPEGESIIVELYAKQFDWTARYAGKDNVLGKRNFKMITDTNPLGLDASDPNGKDDILARTEFHIPKGKTVYFKFGSRDVIHSAYMPHFRAQMNCVPGMTTEFHYIPTITTDSMRRMPSIIKNIEEVNAILAEKGEEPMEFNYLLLCNKICGVSHYNMQMNIIVDEPAEYEAWLAKQKTMGESATAEVKTEQPASPSHSASAEQGLAEKK